MAKALGKKIEEMIADYTHAAKSLKAPRASQAGHVMSGNS